MKREVEFLEDFATFKKGDTTDILSDDIVSGLLKRKIVKLKAKKEPVKSASKNRRQRTRPKRDPRGDNKRNIFRR